MILCTMIHVIWAEESSVTNIEQYRIKDKGENIEEVREYLLKRQKELEEKQNQKEPESSLRRFEVMFFTSGAMVYFSTLIFTKLFAEIYRGRSSELPNTYWTFIVANSVGIGTYIAIKDYYDIAHFQEEKKYGKENQNHYRFSLLRKRF